ncbi:GTP-binding protein [Clostridium neuense]|uniref:sulfate adenylyltransferase n=1 Tax=Clostridium neuense TaxID=1728934 RepID=A0ABW8TKS3_9CLOT
MKSSRENLNIVVVGHVDHGKSTLIGRLLYDTNSLPDGAIEKVKKISKEEGKKFEYAFLLDAFEEEQRQGITIDITMIRFFTKKRDYVIIDAPGHKEFLKNMVSGAASAEAAILVIDANEGIQEQSKRHGYILSLLGIKKVYVAVNKMDLVDYSEERYNEIVEQFNKFLNNLNIYPMGYIPISAFLGDNVASKSDKMPWYNGDSILESMDKIEKEKGIEHKSLRLPIQDIYKFDSKRIIAGRIESGSLSVGDEIVFCPSGKTTKVKSLEFWQKKDNKNQVSAGMSVGITVEDEFYNKRGEVIVHKEDIAATSNFFNANIFWLGKEPLKKGKKYRLKIATQEIEVQIDKIKKVIDAATLEHKENTEVVNKNDVAEVIVKSNSLICFDTFNKNEAMGRFVIIDNYNTSGGGIILGTAETSKNNVQNIKSAINSIERESRMGQKGKVIWITGLDDEVNSKIAVKLEKELFDAGKKVYYLNTNSLTEGIIDNKVNAIANFAKMFSDNGLVTIVSNVSKFSKERKYAKDIIGKSKYIEVFVDEKNNTENEEYEKSDYPVISVALNNNDDFVDKSDELLDIISLS